MSKKLKTNHVSSSSVKIPSIPEEEYTIDILNPHCFLNIFNYLTLEERLNLEEVSETCKYGCTFAWRDTKKLDLEDKSDGGSNQPLPSQTVIRQTLIRCGEYLTKLSLGIKYDCRILTTVTKHCHNLVKLKLELSEKFIQHFDWEEDTFSKMINLKSFELRGSQIKYPPALNSLPENIEKVTLTYTSPDVKKFLVNDDATILAKNIQRWKNLKYLVLERWRIDLELMTSIRQCQTLTHVCLYSSVVRSIDESLSSPAHSPNLEYFDVFLSQSIPQDYLAAVVTNCKNLTHLDLEGTSPCQYAVLYEIRNLNNLEHLNVAYLTGVNDNIINNIVMNCNKLKYLNISYCKEITKKALEKLTCLTNLKELVMNGTQANDSVLLRLKDMKRVECSFLTTRKSVTMVGALGVFQNSLETLRRLDISSTNLTIDDVEYICDVADGRKNSNKLVLIVNHKLKHHFSDMLITSGLVVESRKCKLSGE